MKITATRRVQFAIGHRVMRHESKCRHLHGHNFVFFLTAEADELDELGRVMDFGVLKTGLGGWIEDHWDHGFVLSHEDKSARAGIDVFSQMEGIQQKLFLLQDNPTAENLAKYLIDFVGPQILHGTGVRLTKVVVYETENGIAEASL